MPASVLLCFAVVGRLTAAAEHQTLSPGDPGTGAASVSASGVMRDERRAPRAPHTVERGDLVALDPRAASHPPSSLTDAAEIHRQHDVELELARITNGEARVGSNRTVQEPATTATRTCLQWSAATTAEAAGANKHCKSTDVCWGKDCGYLDAHSIIEHATNYPCTEEQLIAINCGGCPGAKVCIANKCEQDLSEFDTEGLIGVQGATLRASSDALDEIMLVRSKLGDEALMDEMTSGTMSNDERRLLVMKKALQRLESWTTDMDTRIQRVESQVAQIPSTANAAQPASTADAAQAPAPSPRPSLSSRRDNEKSAKLSRGNSGGTTDVGKSSKRDDATASSSTRGTEHSEGEHKNWKHMVSNPNFAPAPVKKTAPATSTTTTRPQPKAMEIEPEDPADELRPSNVTKPTPVPDPAPPALTAVALPKVTSAVSKPDTSPAGADAIW